MNNNSTGNSSSPGGSPGMSDPAASASQRMVPKPKLKRDWIGQKVRLLVQIETRGGEIFRPGEVLTVYGYYRGLDLRSLGQCPACTRSRWLHAARVSESSVELLPEDAPDPEPHNGLGRWNELVQLLRRYVELHASGHVEGGPTGTHAELFTRADVLVKEVAG